MAMDKERESLVESLRSLKVLLGTDSPEVRGWAPAVQQQAQRILNATIAALTAQQEQVAYSRSSPAVDTSAPRTIIEAPPSGVQPADGRASMQAELGAALGSALSHYKSGDMQACAASLVRIVDLFRGAAKEPR